MRVFDEEAELMDQHEAHLLAMLMELIGSGRLTRPEAVALYKSQKGELN